MGQYVEDPSSGYVETPYAPTQGADAVYFLNPTAAGVGSQIGTLTNGISQTWTTDGSTEIFHASNATTGPNAGGPDFAMYGMSFDYTSMKAAKVGAPLAWTGTSWSPDDSLIGPFVYLAPTSLQTGLNWDLALLSGASPTIYDSTGTTGMLQLVDHGIIAPAVTSGLLQLQTGNANYSSYTFNVSGGFEFYNSNLGLVLETYQATLGGSQLSHSLLMYDPGGSVVFGVVAHSANSGVDTGYTMLVQAFNSEVVTGGTSAQSHLIQTTTGTITYTLSPGAADGVTLWIDQGTLTGTTAVTVTTASTVYIAGAPIAGTDMTITNAYALYIASGSVNLSGLIYNPSNTTFTVGNSANTTVVFQTPLYAGGVFKFYDTYLGQVMGAIGYAAITTDRTYGGCILSIGTVAGNSNTAASLSFTDGTNSYLVMNTQTATDGTANFTFSVGSPTSYASAAGSTHSMMALDAYTLIFTGTVGTTAMNGMMLNIAQPTLTDTSAQTTTTASTVFIAGPVIAGGSVTITNNFSLLVNSGSAGFGGAVGVGFVTSTVGNGINIGAGATANSIWTASQGTSTTALYIGNASITVVSDARIKDIIGPTTRSAADIFRALKVVDFTWNDPSDSAPVNRNSRGVWTGITAQQAIQYVPWLVNAEDRNCLTCLAGKSCDRHPSLWNVSWGHEFGLVALGFQEVYKRFETLEEKVVRLEGENTKLIRAVGDLTKIIKSGRST